MMFRTIIAVTLAGTLLSFAACKKKEETQPQVQGPAPTPGIMMPKGETKIVVPDSVKGAWDSATIEIFNKETNKKEAVSIKLNSEYTIPGSQIKLKVGDFLPDFRMDGLTITSASNDPQNPAVHVTVKDGDKEIFKGWLYSKFPSIHPFQHPKYGLTLIEGVKKKG